MPASKQELLEKIIILEEMLKEHSAKGLSTKNLNEQLLLLNEQLASMNEALAERSNLLKG